MSVFCCRESHYFYCTYDQQKVGKLGFEADLVYFMLRSIGSESLFTSAKVSQRLIPP